MVWNMKHDWCGSLRLFGNYAASLRAYSYKYRLSKHSNQWLKFARNRQCSQYRRAPDALSPRCYTNCLVDFWHGAHAQTISTGIHLPYQSPGSLSNASSGSVSKPRFRSNRRDAARYWTFNKFCLASKSENIEKPSITTVYIRWIMRRPLHKNARGSYPCAMKCETSWFILF